MGAKWLAVLLCLSPQMSAALERKEVRTVSNTRVEAIHLVILSPASLHGEPRRYSGSRRKSATREARKVMLHFWGRTVLLFFTLI